MENPLLIPYAERESLTKTTVVVQKKSLIRGMLLCTIILFIKGILDLIEHYRSQFINLFITSLMLLRIRLVMRSNLDLEVPEKLASLSIQRIDDQITLSLASPLQGHNLDGFDPRCRVLLLVFAGPFVTRTRLNSGTVNISLDTGQ